VVQNILATLAHHQQLNSKYILTLIHYKMFVTNLPNPNSGIESNIQT
jgi:hypothetical protein